jgi:hypothetical protein
MKRKMTEQISIEAHDYNLVSCRNKLLNISIISAEAQDFITVKRKLSEEPLLIRPTLHVSQITPFGELKTTTANRIGKYCASLSRHPFYKVSSVTAAAIAGSISEKSEITPLSVRPS